MTDVHFPVGRIIPAFAGSTSDRRWAANWWEYPEAVLRLDAMWRTWEAARASSTGMSSWLRDHADYHMAILTSPDGPFAKSATSCAPGEPLPITPRNKPGEKNVPNAAHI